MWNWVWRVWDQCGRNIKLDEAEMIKMGSLTKILDLVFQPEGLGRGRGWHMDHKWPNARIPMLCCQRFRDTRVLKQIYCANLPPLPWEGPENTFFSITMRKRLGRWAPESLSCSVVALLCRLEITWGTFPTELGFLKVVWVMRPRVAVARKWPFNAKDSVGMVTVWASGTKAVVTIVQPAKIYGIG